jgi:hypothetical protein
MLKSTPEYIAAHLTDLTDKPPTATPEARARFREERRRRRSQYIGRLVAAISRAIPFVRTGSHGEVVSSDPGAAAR